MQKTARSRFVTVNDRGHVVGQDHHRSRFTDHEVWLMLELRAGGMSLPEIARKFETSKSVVHGYVHGNRRAQTGVGQKRLAPVAYRFRWRAAKADEFT